MERSCISIVVYDPALWFESVRRLPRQVRELCLARRLKEQGRTEPTSEELAAVRGEE